MTQACEFTWAGWEAVARAYGWEIHDHHPPVDAQGKTLAYHYPCPDCAQRHWAIPALEARGTACSVEDELHQVVEALRSIWRVSPQQVTVALRNLPAVIAGQEPVSHNRSVADANSGTVGEG